MFNLENYLGPRFKENSNKYKFDKWLFKPFFFFMFAYLFFVAYHYDYKLNYFNCINGPSQLPDNILITNNENKCLNPFYKPITWENEKYLSPGEYGTKLGGVFYSAYYVPLILFALYLLLNHLIYNRGKKIFELDLNIKEVEK